MKIPEGICPNCWGQQEYDNLYRSLIIDRQIDVNNKITMHSFINEFTTTYLDGIKLKNQRGKWICPKCNMSGIKNKEL